MRLADYIPDPQVQVRVVEHTVQFRGRRHLVVTTVDNADDVDDADDEDDERDNPRQFRLDPLPSPNPNPNPHRR